MRCDDATKLHKSERYRNFEKKITKRKFLFGRYLAKENKTNTIYGRKWS
jgi:hypothetical protein